VINKKSIWFLTLFSLILVLSVYYITMPSELLLNTNGNYNGENVNTEVNTEIEENTILVALRLEEEELLAKEMESLQIILTDDKSSIEDKNDAFDKMKKLNIKRGEEESLEQKINENFKVESFVKIKNDQIEVVISKANKSNELANKIIRSIQENYEEEKYITVKFVS